MPTYVPIPFPESAWPLFRKALEHIAAHPAEFYMGTWFVDLRNPLACSETVTEATGLPVPECGTAACLAGHVALAAGVDPRLQPITGETALEVLGVASYNNDVANRLYEVFGCVEVTTYEGLREVLEERFTFPEPLPAVVA